MVFFWANRSASILGTMTENNKSQSRRGHQGRSTWGVRGCPAMVEMTTLVPSEQVHKQEDSKAAAAAARDDKESRGRQTLSLRSLVAHSMVTAIQEARARATGQDAGMEKGMGNSAQSLQVAGISDV